MAWVDNRVVLKPVKDLGLDVIEQSHKVTLGGGLAQATWEDGVTHKEVHLTVNLHRNGNPTRGVSAQNGYRDAAVSYTHLTLPTNREV